MVAGATIFRFEWFIFIILRFLKLSLFVYSSVIEIMFWYYILLLDGFHDSHLILLIFLAIPPVLLVANRYYIRNISVMENHTELVSKRLNNAVAVDFLWNNGNSSIYWSDVTSNGSSISVMNLDGNERRVIILYYSVAKL